LTEVALREVLAADLDVFFEQQQDEEARRMAVQEVPERPLLGRAAATNEASSRVLEKCGFVRRDLIHDVVAPSGEVVSEVLLELRAPAHG
jgi:hypothetical protein